MKRADEFIANFPSFFNGLMKDLQIVKESGPLPQYAGGIAYRWAIIDCTARESPAMQEFKRLPLWKRFLRPLPPHPQQVAGSLSARSARGGIMYLYLAPNVLDEYEGELICIVADYERQMPATIVIIPDEREKT